MKKSISRFFLILVFIARILASAESVKVMRNFFQPKVTIVIDPGHGGRDPGKVGVNQALEKDINLAIALRLRITRAK